MKLSSFEIIACYLHAHPEDTLVCDNHEYRFSDVNGRFVDVKRTNPYTVEVSECRLFELSFESYFDKVNEEMKKIECEDFPF